MHCPTLVYFWPQNGSNTGVLLDGGGEGVSKSSLTGPLLRGPVPPQNWPWLQTWMVECFILVMSPRDVNEWITHIVKGYEYYGEEENLFQKWMVWRRGRLSFIFMICTCSTLQNSHHAVHCFSYTLTTWWLDSDGVVTVINCWQHSDCCSVTLLPAVDSSDYIVTTLSLSV